MDTYSGREFLNVFRPLGGLFLLPTAFLVVFFFFLQRSVSIFVPCFCLGLSNDKVCYLRVEVALFKFELNSLKNF